MSSKSLVRLFPTDQSMVVVIDDRSDVWGDCPNLVKVVPYDFFIGIGDINGSFLPPTQPAVTPIPAAAAAAAASSPSTAASSPGPETPPEIPSTEDGLLLQSKLLDDLAEKRPLAKLEEETERAEEEAESAAEAAEAEGSGKPEKDATAEPQAAQAPAAQAHHPHPHPHHRKQLLNPEDHELERVAGVSRTPHLLICADALFRSSAKSTRASTRHSTTACPAQMPCHCSATRRSSSRRSRTKCSRAASLPLRA